MSTESTVALTKQLVSALLAYAPPPLTGGSTVAELTSSRVYVGRPPDGTAYPYVLCRIQGWQTDAQYNNQRATGTLECLVYARPRTKAEEAEEIADRIAQCFASYRVTSSAIVFGTSVQRQSLPNFSDPADKEVVAIRLAIGFACWPSLLLGGPTAA